jgi:hypothetical protein
MNDEDFRKYIEANAGRAKLDLFDTVITDHGLEMLLRCKDLECLRLPPATTNAGMDLVTQMHWLKELSLSGIEIDDDGLSGIYKIAGLERIYLSTLISDNGAKHLSKLGNLRVVGFLGSDVKDSGLRAMAATSSLSKLTETHLSSAMSDQCMEVIAKIQTLEKIILVPSISDRGIAFISGSASIRSLMCSRLVTDESLPVLATFNVLEELYLTSKNISPDAVLDWIPKMKRLNRLFLPDHISEGCKVMLRKRMPNCSI